MSLWGLGNISPFFPIILIFELLSKSVFETLSPNGQSVNFAQETLWQLDLRSLSFISGRGKRAGNHLEVEFRPKVFQQQHSVISVRGKREENTYFSSHFLEMEFWPKFFINIWRILTPPNLSCYRSGQDYSFFQSINLQIKPATMINVWKNWNTETRCFIFS